MPPYTNPSTHTEHSRALGYGWIQEGTEQNQKPERAGWKLDVVLAGFLFLFFFFFVDFSPFLHKGEIMEFGGLLDKVRRREAGRAQKRRGWLTVQGDCS